LPTPCILVKSMRIAGKHSRNRPPLVEAG